MFPGWLVQDLPHLPPGALSPASPHATLPWAPVPTLLAFLQFLQFCELLLASGVIWGRGALQKSKAILA